jgi:hypothetical protein
MVLLNIQSCPECLKKEFEFGLKLFETKVLSSTIKKSLNYSPDIEKKTSLAIVPLSKSQGAAVSGITSHPSVTIKKRIIRAGSKQHNQQFYNMFSKPNNLSSAIPVPWKNYIM